MKIQRLGLQAYQPIFDAMKQFTIERNQTTQDELWLLEHPSVYTQGQAGKAEHILEPKNIPIIQSDRGGQVTYHGPGQLVAYVLMDLKRRHMGIRTLVSQLEHVLITVLKDYNIHAVTRCGAPGVYVDEKKIASIGLRVKNGCTYHGIALNVAMELEPFSRINPCGFARLEVTQIEAFMPKITVETVQESFIEYYLNQFDT